jgi:hypothetical protein
VWNVPPRNLAFTGRDRLLATVRKQLLSGDRAVVQALRGMGENHPDTLSSAQRLAHSN